MDDAFVEKIEAEERAATRQQMADLRELSNEYDWDCIGLKNLLWQFGNLIAQEVETGLVVPARHQSLYPVVLDTVAKWADYHAVEYQDPEEQHVAEALDRVKQAAVSARHIVAAFERGRYA